MAGALGCIARHLKEELLPDKNFPVNFMVGPDGYKKLPDMVAQRDLGL